MKKLNNPTENFVSRRINQRRVRRWVALLSALVLFLTVNTLKLEADTLERIATCGIEQHVHDESCYDASGALTCGLAEHAHTDACFQQRPQRHDLTRVDGFMPLNAKVTLATPMPKLTSNSADGQDAVQAEADYYSDIPTEVGSGIEPPVDEIETELAGEDAAPAVEDAVPLEIVYEDQAEETVQQPEYVINGSTVLLSDILSVLGMKASGIQTVGELEGDTFAEDPVNFAVEATQNDYELRVLRDFDAAELGVMTDDEVIIITLKNGIAPVEDNDDENPSENDDINIEETHTGETDDEAAADETVDEETEDSADEATEETVDELTEDTDDEETEEAADEMTVDATEEETVETVEETETAAVVPDKLVALDFADYDCLADATVYFYAPDRGAVLVNAEELAEADGVHLTVNAPVVLSMEADLGLAELEAALEEAPEDIDVRIGENPVLFENGVLIISGDGELTVNGVTYSVTNVTLPSRSVESDNIIISTVDDQATLLGVTPAFEDNGEDEGDIYALFAAQMDENIVTATSEEIQVDAIEPAKGLLRSSAMMAAEDAAPEAEEAVADAEETVADAEETAETENAEAAVETRTLRVRVYDVSLIREGESVEPDAPIHVETTFDAPLEGENFQLYHIVDGKPEAVDGFVKTDDQGRAIGMSFDTASLSPFAVVYYTVEYTTDNNEVTVKLDFTDIVKNGVDFDTNSVITALNDGVAVRIDELEQGYIEGTDSVVNGELYIDYTTADNKNESIKNVNWIGFNVVNADEGLTVADGKIKVTKDGTVVLSDGISTVTVVISNYEKLVAKELTSQGVDITVLNGEVPAGSEVSYTALDEAKTSELVEQYNIDSDVEGVAHTAFDVSIAMPEGQEFTEAGEFAVAVDLPVDEKAGDFKLYHIHEGQVEELPVEVVDGKVLFTTSSFSEFVLSYTVDFEYNGYQFSMPGGGVLLLSELFEALGIEENVADVVDVTFTDYDLLKVEKLPAGSTYRVSIDTFEGFTDEEIDALEPNTVISVDKTPIDRVVRADNWLLTSQKPFTSAEQLTIRMADGTQIVIDVTDDMQTNTDGSVVMQSVATVRTSVAKKVTQNEQERNATFDINMGILFSKAGLTKFQAQVAATDTVPALVYDFSSEVTESPIQGMIEGGTFDLKDDGVTVGTVTIDPSGKAIIQYDDPAWVTRKTSIGANITLHVGTNETFIPANDEYTWNFPDSNTVTVKYKKSYTTEAKKYELTGSAETGWTANYTAKFTNTAQMDSLTFTDEIGSDDLQTLNASSIRVTKDGADVTSQWTQTDVTEKGFTLTNSNSPAAGEYVVTYSTNITQAQYEAMQEGSESWEYNKATWNLNGNLDIPGGETNFKIDKPKPPEPPVNVEKSSDKEDQEVARGGEINYTVKYETTKLNGLSINDKMTDVQILDPSSVVIKIDGQVISTPAGFVNYYNDNNFSPWNMTDVFNYQFPEDGPYPEKGSNYVVEITYKTTLIDQETAKSNNIFDGVSVKNTAHESRYNTTDTTTSTVTFDKEIIHDVDKSAEAGTLTADGDWAPGSTITYTIRVGDGTTDLVGVRVVDKMTGLQKLNSGSVQISYGNDQSYSALTDGIVYDFSQDYTTNDVNVIDLVLPQSVGNGPVYIKYTTTVMSQEEATARGIYDPKYVNNNVTVGEKGHDGTSGTVPYEPEPKFPLTKTVTIEDDQKETSGSTKLGGRVNYEVTFGDSTIADMSGVKIRDEMTDVQKLVGDVVVTLAQPLAADITLQDGTVVTAGSTYFTMPTSSNAASEDGVAWAAWLDDGKYDINSNVRVFYYTLPEGVGPGPIKVNYAVDVITEEEAKTAGINDTHNVYNTAWSGNNSHTTEYPVDFPKNLPHTPQATKAFTKWGEDNKTVYWRITVDKTADSAFPLTDVKVIEDTNSGIAVYYMNDQGWWQQYQLHGTDFNMLSAVVTTESGNVLDMGTDYEIYRGGNSTSDCPYFFFPVLNEKVTIDISYTVDHVLTDGFKRSTLFADGYHQVQNTVTVNGTSVTVYEDKDEPDKIELLKTGTFDETNRVLTWKVQINPDQKVLANETTFIKFEDYIPNGLELLNYYDYKENNLRNTNDPTVHVAITTLQSAYEDSNYRLNIDKSDSLNYSVTRDPDDPNHITVSDIQCHVDPYNTGINREYGLSGRCYTITYYTQLSDAEWERITSSANGSKTYENTAVTTFDGKELRKSTEVRVESKKKFIEKEDTTQHGDYTGIDGQTHRGVVITEDGNGENTGSDYISYKIEINPNAAALNRVDPDTVEGTVTYDPITLTDRIATNMDFDPSTLHIYKYGTPGDDTTLTDVNADTEGLVISYNDDTRLLAIAGLHDKTAYRVEYKNKVRAQGEDTFTNTATLTGGGSHSSTTSETHKVENVTDDSTSYDMELDLHKIKETDITSSLANVTFELWQVELEEDTDLLTDAEWEALFTSTNNNTTTEEVLAKFKRKNAFKLDTMTTNADGIARFPTGKIAIHPKTVYYWIETVNGNDDYKPENVPHYFVLYPDKEIVWLDKETGDTYKRDVDGLPIGAPDGADLKLAKILLSATDLEQQQHIAWALDNAYTLANNVTVASMASGVTWSVNNLEKKYTTISATKEWKGDANNLFETRPNQGIKLTLYQKLGENGEWVIYNPKTETPRLNQNPVTIRGSQYTYTDASGKTVTAEDWPQANWIRLPAYKYHRVQDDVNGTYLDVIEGYYYYKVVEEPVENYTTTYTPSTTNPDGSAIDLENDGISKGKVTVTNTYIPPTTSIGVHKTFHVASGTNLPEQIVVELYQYKKDASGVVTGPTDYGMMRTLTAENDWNAIFKGLPTRDGNGNTFSYAVVEDIDALEDAGFEYTLTEYIPDGQMADFGGYVSGTIEIVNHGPGSLKIEKNVTINGKTVEASDTGADGTYTFHILKDGVEVEGKSPVTITIENGVSNSVVVSDLAAGEYTIHEDTPANGTAPLVNDVKVKVIGGVDDPAEVEVAGFTNNIDKTRVKVRKSWVNANRDAEGNVVNGTNTDWPRGVTVSVTLKKTSDGGATKESVDTPTWYTANNKTWNDTVVLSSVRQFYVFDNLDALESGYQYTVVETITGADDRSYDQFISTIDEDGTIEVVNAEKTDVEFTKIWDNTTAGNDGSTVYQRGNLTVKVKLHRYYTDESGDLVLYDSPAETGLFNTEIEVTDTNAVSGTYGDVTLEKTSESGDSQWKLLWSGLPTTGVVDGNVVKFTYKAEETDVLMTGGSSVASDYDTTVSDDGLTITNKYKNGTSVAVEKKWSDGKQHSDDAVEMTLYQSNIAPDGTGTPYSANIRVSSWQDVNGGTDSAPSNGSITVSFDPADNAPVTLNSINEWSDTVSGLKKGIEYTVTYVCDGTYVLGVGSAVVDGTDITLMGVVPAPSHTVRLVQNGVYETYQDENGNWTTGNHTKVFGTAVLTGSSVIVGIHWWNPTKDKLQAVSVTCENANVTKGSSYVASDYSTILPFTVSGINGNVDLVVNWGELGAGYQFDFEVDEGSSTPSFIPVTSSTLYQGNSTDYTIPENKGNWAVVSGTGITNPITLNSDALSGKWAYEWAALPTRDANGDLYYYVMETGHTGSTTLVDTDPVQYEFEFRDTEPKSITKVKITNNVKGGELNVTKAATFNPTTTDFATKEYYFTVYDKGAGKYVQDTTGTLGSDKKWFALKAGQIVSFPNLPTGAYTVTEDVDGAKIDGYSLSATGGGDVTVNATTPTTATLTNTYTKEYGSITVEKETLVSDGKGNTTADDTVDDRTVTIGLFESQPTRTSTATKTATITLGADGTGNTTFTQLELGQTYYVYELDANNHPALLTEGESTINSVEYTVAQDAVSAALSTTVKTATVKVTNTREELKGSVKVTKAFIGIDSFPSSFKITATWKEDGVDKSQELTLATNGMTGTGTISDPYTWTISDLPLDTEVTFTETGMDVAGYSVTANGTANATTATASATADKTPGEATFTNVYTPKTGSVTFTQKKVFTNGNQATAFGYTITEYTDNTYDTVKSVITRTGSMSANADGVTAVSYAMSDVGDHYYIVKENLPAGTTPTADDTAKGYIIVDGVKYDLNEHQYVVNVSEGDTALVVKKDTVEVTNIDTTFTNEKLGKLTVTKSLALNPADDGNFQTTYQHKKYTVTITTGEAPNVKYLKADGTLSDTEETHTVSNATPLVIENVPAGTYTVTEKDTGRVIAGYKFDGVTGVPADFKAAINGDEKTVALTNTYEESKTDIHILKVKDDGTTALDGATFSLTKTGGDQAFENQTTANGRKADFTGLKAGTYTLSEAGVPAGYKGITGDITFTLTETDGVFTLERTDSTADVTLDGDTFTFTVKNHETTDIKVTKEWKNSEGGDHTSTNGDTITFALHQVAGEADTVFATGLVVTYKKDGSYAYTTAMGTLTEGEAATGWGTTTITGLPKYAADGTTPYNYYVVETAVSENGVTIETSYKVGTGEANGTASSVTVQNNTNPIVIVNQDVDISTSIKVIKVDAHNNTTKLNGATFELKRVKDGMGADVTEEPVTQTTTSEGEAMGTATFGNLQAGTYELTETQSPAGYKTTFKKATFTVNRNGNTMTVTYTDGTNGIVTYSSDNQAFTVTNEPLVDIDATKTWKQNVDDAGDLNATITNAEVTYTLYRKIGDREWTTVVADGITNRVTLKVENAANADAWKARWTGLDKYSGEDLISYKVVESGAKVNGEAITLPATAEVEATEYKTVAGHTNPTAEIGLTNTLPKTSISVVKSWKDTSTGKTTPPTGAKATLGLYKLSGADTTAVTVTRHDDDSGEDETVHLTVTLDGTQVTDPAREGIYGYAEDAWKATWKNLPKYDANGALIKYVVKEESTEPAMTFKPLYDRDEGKTYAESTVENQYTSFRVQKRWMSNHTTWNPKYTVDTIYYHLYKVNGESRELVGELRELKASTTIDVQVKVEDRVYIDETTKAILDKAIQDSVNGFSKSGEGDSAVYTIPYADEITPLPILDAGWSYEVVECSSAGVDFEQGNGKTHWTCDEFDGSVRALKNDLTDVKATKSWDDKSNEGIIHPAITFTLKRTTDTGLNWENGKGYSKNEGTITWENVDIYTIEANATGTALTVTWADQPKYSIVDGKKYTYYVEESSVPGYKLKNSQLSGGEYAFSFENELTTTELTVEKKWKINGEDATQEQLEAVPEITYQVWREAYSDSEKTTKIDDSDENITDALKARTTGQIAGQLPIVTTTGEAPNVVESYAWTETVTNLPTTGQRETTTTDDNGTPEDDTDDTTTTTYSTVYYKYYIVETADPNGLYPSQTVTTLTDGKYVINNELTKISVTKKWKLNGIDVLNTELPQGSDGAPITSISFTLYQYDPTATEGNGIKVYTGHNGTGNYTITVKEEGEAPNTTYTWETLDIKWLPRYADATHKYEYYIVEDAISGHSSTVTKSDLTTVVNSGARVEDGEIVITNSKYSVSLPSTGGPGTTGFYVLGSILTLLALILLVTKKRSDGAGIE